MIETIVNAVQLIFAAIGAGFSAYRCMITHRREWLLCSLAVAAYFLGDLYWQLFLMFYGRTPHFSYIPDFGWYASYIFMLLLLVELRGDTEHPAHIKKPLLLIPIFTFGMCAYFSRFGEIPMNLLSAGLMTLLLWNTFDFLIDIHKGATEKRACKRLCIVILVFCAAEYGSWIASCSWQGDTLSNPYFWFDTLMSLTFLLFPHAVEKARKYGLSWCR